MRARWWVPVLLAVLVPLAGCGAVSLPTGGGASPAVAGPSASTSAPSPPAASASSPGAGSASSPAGSAPPQPAPQKVTMADNGDRFTMKVGQTFTLALGDLRWSPQVADPSVLARLPNFAMIRGAQGIYKAYRAGSTTLRASGAPVCGAGQACPMFVLLFQITVRVTA